MLSSLVELLERVGLTKEQQVLLMRASWIGVVTFHICWVCGWLTILGMPPPFVYAQDAKQQAQQAQGQYAKLDQRISDTNHQLADLVDELKKQRIERLQEEVNGTQAQICHARKTKNFEALSVYSQRLQYLSGSFLELAGHAPSIIPCDI